MTQKIAINVSDEDHILLKQLKDAGWDFHLGLSPGFGGFFVTKGDDGLQWIFFSKVLSFNGGPTYDDHGKAIDSILI